MKTQTIMSQSQFKSTVNAHCEERSNSSAEAGSAGVSGYFSASASRAEASYGKFCSKDTDDRGSESDYHEYMEGVQPGAYAAYAACTAARNSDGVQFEMSEAPTRDRLVLGIYNRTNTRGTADMQWAGSDPVTCQWAGDAGGTPRRTLQPDERAFLECRRSSFDSEPLREPDAVDVFRADGGDAAVLNIPWPKYGPDNSPVLTLEEMKRNLERDMELLRAELAELAERVVNFGPAEEKALGQAHQARSGGLVTALVGATGDPMRQAICAWVAPDEDSLASPQAREDARMVASDVAQVSGGGANIPYGAISMPVRSGEYWTVTQCAGGPRNSAVRVLFHPMMVARGER